MSLSSFANQVRGALLHPTGRAWRWLWRLAAGLLLLLWSLALLVWLTLHWGILPRLDDWRPRIEAQATRALGQTVQIGRIGVRSSGWVPAFDLEQVVLRDSAGREALRLPRVSAALSVTSLLALQLRFEQLLVDGARLEVRRDRQGHWHVAGLDIASAGTLDAGDASTALDWLFSQPELIVRGATLRWVDEARDAPALQLTDLLLVLRNNGARHALRLDATPPADWGQRFSVRAQAQGPLLGGLGGARPGDWRRWRGTLYADLPLADASRLRRHVNLPIDLQQGRAALRAWLDFDQGQPQALTLDAALRSVSVRLGQALEPMAFDQLSTRLHLQRQPDGVALALQGLQFVGDQGQRWEPSTLNLRWQQHLDLAGPDGLQALVQQPITGGEFSADRLDLAPLAQLAERLPIGQSLRHLLQQTNPEGQVLGLSARWQGALDAPTSYQASARLRGLAIAAAPSPEPDGIGRPGWRGANLDLSANEKGGQARLTLDRGAIELPGVFAQASVALNRFAAQLEWRLLPAVASSAAAPRVELKLRDARFANDDAEGRFNASWHTGGAAGFGRAARLPGVISLDGQLSRGQARQVARYLPLGISGPVRDWVRHAVQGGEVRDVRFRVQGDLWDFPFVNRAAGEFRIAAQLHDVLLAPVPSMPAAGTEPAWTSPWPAFGKLSAELVFERDAMQFSGARGQLWGLELLAVKGRIPALSPDALLEIDGQVRGPAADLLRYVNTTPLAGVSAQVLAQALVNGPAELKLALSMPLARPENTRVQAQLQLPGNDFQLRPDLPQLQGARGQVLINEQGVQLSALRAQALGGELQIDGGSQADQGFALRVAGQASAEGLRQSAALASLLGPAAPPWLGRLSGQAAYQLGWSTRQGQTEFSLDSKLQGMAIDLPAPLTKTAAEGRNLRLRSSMAAGQGDPAFQPFWQLQLGPLQAAWQVDPADPRGRPLRSALAYNAALPEPVPQGHAVLAPDRLDLDAWRALWTPGGPLANTASGNAAEPLLHHINLRTPELLLWGRRLNGLALDLRRLVTPAELGWRAELQSRQASGTVDYLLPRRAGSGADASGHVRARLARLSLPPADAEQVTGLLDQAPANVPSLDIEVDAFELRGLALGRLAVQAVNRPAVRGEAGRSEWRLDKLLLDNGDARLNATGRWHAQPGQPGRRMDLDFTLGVVDGGALLQRLGHGALVTGAKGELSGVLGWSGSPLALDLPTLAGQLRVQLSGGRFLKANAGAARLLGVLSLQALPRRLVLDFRDLFEAGFAFDEASGDVLIRQGVASSRNLRLLGLQAAVLMEGQADLIHETQDLQVVVLPELNTTSASLAYAAINPAVGLGVLFGQWLLSEPLRQASAREFHISGGWDDPQVQRVQRKLLAPLPEAAAALPGLTTPPRAEPRPAAGPGAP